MSCIFCDSTIHFSEYCSNYKSDESRIKFLSDRNLCHSCLLPKSEPLHDHGIFNNKCFICYSVNHHSIFCPHRETKPKSFFLPKIEDSLLPRFLKRFDSIEKYAMAFSSQKALELIELKPLKICGNVDYRKAETEIEKFAENSKLILNGNLIITNLAMKINSEKRVSDFYQAISSKAIIIKASCIQLVDCSLTTYQNPLQILTPFTKDLYLDRTLIYPQVFFAEIHAKIPNIEHIHIDGRSNIEIENSWPDDLLNCKIGSNFQTLDIFIPSYDFDVESLAKFIETKCTNQATSVQINLRSKLPLTEFEKFQPRLLQYFVRQTSFVDSGKSLIFSSRLWNGKRYAYIERSRVEEQY